MKPAFIIAGCVFAYYMFMGGGMPGMPGMSRGARSFGGDDEIRYSPPAMRMSDYEERGGDTRGHY